MYLGEGGEEDVVDGVVDELVKLVGEVDCVFVKVDCDEID